MVVNNYFVMKDGNWYLAREDAYEKDGTLLSAFIYRCDLERKENGDCFYRSFLARSGREKAGCDQGYGHELDAIPPAEFEYEGNSEDVTCPGTTSPCKKYCMGTICYIVDENQRPVRKTRGGDVAMDYHWKGSASFDVYSLNDACGTEAAPNDICGGGDNGGGDKAPSAASLTKSTIVVVLFAIVFSLFF